MKAKSSGFFWPSFTDLMTSMFFIMLVLFVLSYARLKIKVEDLARKLKIYELVEQNLKPLKQDTLLFRYEENYKRFTLAFDVNFALSKAKIQRGDLNNYDITASKIQSVGRQLQATIDNLARNKANNSAMNNVSYLVIISGYASHLLSGSQVSDYELSYERAYNLWAYWKSIGIDFEDAKYRDLIDLQISGNGWGGVGRFDRDPQNFMQNETKNQRFIIQIVPKIGDTQ
jgi:outer membrane protein OmpA-like peptidoglycan-associated protein